MKYLACQALGYANRLLACEEVILYRTGNPCGNWEWMMWLVGLMTFGVIFCYYALILYRGFISYGVRKEVLRELAGWRYPLSASPTAEEVADVFTRMAAAGYTSHMEGYMTLPTSQRKQLLEVLLGAGAGQLVGHPGDGMSEDAEKWMAENRPVIAYDGYTIFLLPCVACGCAYLYVSRIFFYLFPAAVGAMVLIWMLWIVLGWLGCSVPRVVPFTRVPAQEHGVDRLGLSRDLSEDGLSVSEVASQSGSESVYPTVGRSAEGAEVSVGRPPFGACRLLVKKPHGAVVRFAEGGLDDCHQTFLDLAQRFDLRWEMDFLARYFSREELTMPSEDQLPPFYRDCTSVSMVVTRCEAAVLELLPIGQYQEFVADAMLTTGRANRVAEAVDADGNLIPEPKEREVFDFLPSFGEPPPDTPGEFGIVVRTAPLITEKQAVVRLNVFGSLVDKIRSVITKEESNDALAIASLIQEFGFRTKVQIAQETLAGLKQTVERFSLFEEPVVLTVVRKHSALGKLRAEETAARVALVRRLELEYCDAMRALVGGTSCPLLMGKTASRIAGSFRAWMITFTAFSNMVDAQRLVDTNEWVAWVGRTEVMMRLEFQRMLERKVQRRCALRDAPVPSPEEPIFHAFLPPSPSLGSGGSVVRSGGVQAMVGPGAVSAPRARVAPDTPEPKARAPRYHPAALCANAMVAENLNSVFLCTE